MSEIAANVLVAFGVLFALTGNIGILRFPDVYTRLQASSKCTTTSVICVLSGLILMSPCAETTVRLLLIGVFALVTGPVASHAIARSAYKSGVKPWTRPAMAIDVEEKAG